MPTKARRIAVALCWLYCLLTPAVMALLVWRFNPDTLHLTGESLPDWPVQVIDGLFWGHLFLTPALIFLAQNWWWLAALVVIPLLVLTADLAIFGGMWIDSSYW